VIFDQYLAVSQTQYKGQLLQNADSNSYAIYRMVPFPKIYLTVSSHQKFHEAQFINKHRLK